jgi:hypothetical protein
LILLVTLRNLTHKRPAGLDLLDHVIHTVIGIQSLGFGLGSGVRSHLFEFKK